MSARPAVFLDRDGTLMEEVNYCSRPEDVRIFPDVPGSLRRLKNAGFLTIIITNQAGIGREYFSEDDFQNVQDELLRQIGDGLIDATYHCADHPDRATARRKPGVGMIEEAMRDFEIDLPRSWLIGDKKIDIDCGSAAGLQTILVHTGYGKEMQNSCEPTYQANELASSVDYIMSDMNQKLVTNDAKR